ncbi:MAG: hypothetical protein ACE5JQ_03325 [Candidatus Methylomirabilales bacterium]
MKSRRIAVVEDDPTQDGQDLNEFNEEELRRLGERGITPYHLARFLESLRNNLDPSSLRRVLILFDGSREQEQCYTEFV